MKRFLIVAVMFPMLATSALAESGSNIFLSGKVFKGDEVVASFAAPTLLGNTLPVKDQVLHSYIEKAVSDGKNDADSGQACYGPRYVDDSDSCCW